VGFPQPGAPCVDACTPGINWDVTQSLTPCARLPNAQVEQEHLTSRNILLEKLRAVRETEAAETQAHTSSDLGAQQASDASTGTEVCSSASIVARATQRPASNDDHSPLPLRVACWTRVLLSLARAHLQRPSMSRGSAREEHDERRFACVTSTV